MAVFRVLSLDGGGMRGVYTAAFLDRLSTYFGAARGCQALDVGKGFDLITGTSTGAIVASALATGKPLGDIVQMYRDYGPSIFPSRISGPIAALVRGLFGGSRAVRWGDAALKKALSEVLGEWTMSDVFDRRGIALSIPAVRMSQHRAYVFKKTRTSGHRDDKFRLADVCLASSAAPIYRSLAAIKDPNSNRESDPPLIFADGGLWANNPVLVGLVDALLSAPKDADVQVFCVGTCPRPEGDHLKSREVHRSMLGWWYGAKVAPLSIAAQEFAFDNMARMLGQVLTEMGRPVSCIRFPKSPMPASTMKFLDLDDSRPEAIDRLIGQAVSDADATKSACDDVNNQDGRLIRAAFENMPTA